MEIHIFSTVLGGILASFIAIIIWEWYQQPDLEINTPSNKNGNAFSVQHLANETRAFYKLEIKNLGNAAAFNCKINIRFINPILNSTIFELSGKWDFGPEPVIHIPVFIQLNNGNIIRRLEESPQGFLVPFSEVIDIHPDSIETFCLLLKYDNEVSCWGFSAWGYIRSANRDHRVPDWELNLSNIQAEVSITYSGSKSTISRFQIDNLRTDHDSVNIRKIHSHLGTKKIYLRRIVRKAISSLTTIIS